MTNNWADDPEIQKQVDYAFPKTLINVRPLADNVLFQVMAPRETITTSGGVVLYKSTVQQDSEKRNTQMAKVLKLGPLAFKDISTLQDWPEGPWYEEGDVVLIPLWGGLRYEVPIPNDPENRKVYHVVYRAKDAKVVITGNPLELDSNYIW